MILKTGYWEVVPRPNISQDPMIARRGNVADVAKVFRPEGSITFRRAETPHRVVLLRAYPSERMVPREEMRPVEAVTLFFTGFRRRDWFFYCAKGPVPWQVFTSSRDRGAVGRGCE